MKLLFLTSRLPWPPNRGDRIRTYHLLKQLSEDYEITLVSFYSKQSELDGSEALKKLCDEVHFVFYPFWQSILSTLIGFWRGTPLQVEYYRSRKMERLIAQLLENTNFSAVYLHLFRMVPYLAKNPEYYRIVDLTDAISQEILKSLPYRSLISRVIHKVEFRRIARYECEVAAWADECWLISKRDKQFIFDNCNTNNLIVIPNGVNMQIFSPNEGSSKKFDLIFVGNLDVYHNVDALNFLILEIFPLIRQDLPDCKLALVGAGQGKGITNLKQLPGISYLGYVGDLNAVLNSAKIFIAPLRFSAGIQNKVLEAMAAAIPVLSTNEIALSLGADPGKHLMTAEGAIDFSKEALTLLNRTEFRVKIGHAGRQFVGQNFSWRAAGERMKIIKSNLETIEHPEMNEGD